MEPIQAKEHTLILGWSKSTDYIVEELLNINRETHLIVDETDIPLISQRRSFQEHEHFQLHATELIDVQFLDDLSLPHSAAVIISTPEDDLNLMLALAVRDFQLRHQCNYQIVVSIQNEKLKKTLFYAGITYVATPDDYIGKLLASAAFEPEVAQFIDDISSSVEDSFEGNDLQEHRILPDAPLVSKTFGTSLKLLKQETGCLLIAVGKKNKNASESNRLPFTLYPNPKPSLVIEAGDIILTLGTATDHSKLNNYLHVDQGM
jgi:Trk K+ transport system NAD-binding subunit